MKKCDAKWQFETRRLTIRPLQLEDYEACKVTRDESLLSPEESTGNFLAVSQGSRSSFCKMLDYRCAIMLNDDAIVFGMFAKESGRYIGDAMLYDIDRGDCSKATIGLAVASVFRGKGYGREAIRGLLVFAFSDFGLFKVEGRIEIGNEISRRACQAAGFLTEGTSPRRVMDRGQWRNMWIISATRASIDLSGS